MSRHENIHYFSPSGKEIIREGREKWNEIGKGRDERRGGKKEERERKNILSTYRLLKIMCIKN